MKKLADVTKEDAKKEFVTINEAYRKEVKDSSAFVTAKILYRRSKYSENVFRGHWATFQDLIAECYPEAKKEVTEELLVKEFIRVNEEYRKEKDDPNGFIPIKFFYKKSKYRETDYRGFWATSAEVRNAAYPDSNAGRMTRDSIHIIKNSSHRKGKVHRYFISSVLPDSELDKDFFNSVLGYCKTVDAELVILPMRGVHHSHMHYHEEVEAKATEFVTQYDIGSNLKVLEAKLSPMAADPVGSSKRLATHNSLIIAHPKQDMISLPVLEPGTKPKVVVSTGVLTKREYPRTASGFKGEMDSILGGVILEYETNTERFFWRFVRANDDGSFYDIGTQYLPNGKTKKVNAEYLYAGDVHSGWVLDYARKATIDQANTLGVKTVGAGDWLDFYSASHHHEKDIKTKVKKHENRPDLNTIKAELETLAEELKVWRKSLNKGITIDIIKSNHDEHLTRYLMEERFTGDVPNYKIAIELIYHYLNDVDPIKYYIEKNHKELRTGINWISRKDVKRITPKKILVSAHGDQGPNGAKSTNVNAESSLQACILGHTHSPSVLRSVFRVGTLALDLEYAKGASSWQVMNCVVYPNGARQMLWIDNQGRWHL